MATFYHNSLFVAGNRDDIDAFMDDVGIPRDLVGHSDGTDCDVYEGENKRLNDEQFRRFNMTAKEAAGIHLDRVRTEYRNDGIWIGFDSWGWHGGDLCFAFGPHYPRVKFLIHFFNDPHYGRVLRVHGSTWEAWAWTNEGIPGEVDDHRCLGYGALSCFGEHVWERIGRPGNAPEVTDKIPMPGMVVIDETGEYFGHPFQDDIPKPGVSPE